MNGLKLIFVFAIKGYKVYLSVYLNISCIC